VSEQPATPAGTVSPAGQRLLDVYDVALPQVYGYLLARCGAAPVAEDLTAETFLAAVDSARRDPSTSVSVPWLIGVARHKLVDHWRARAREERGLRAVHYDPVLGEPEVTDPWDERLDALLAKDTLARLGPHHRAALTLRYLDDLPVPQVAEILGRTLHATEALLVRAREAFRRTYTDVQSNPPSRNREEDDRG
jgi:RNA polymerase sigma-70 factor (ECF subfamily)